MFKSVKLRSLFLFVTMLGSVGLFAQDAEVSDAELTQFAHAYQSVQVQNQEAQEQMITIIQDEGMELERFGALQEATMNPEAKSDATPEEMKKLASVTSKIQEMQPELEKKATKGIEAAGLSMERYQALAAVIQKDQNLLQRLQSIMTNE